MFESELELNLLKLCSDLNTGMYQHGGYNHRIVNEKKRRDIAVASVRDRVAHRLLYDYLVPIVDPRFDYDVWSCRTGKGLHSALRRTQQLEARFQNGWVWRADISKFFDNVEHLRLKDSLNRMIVDHNVLHLLDKVIDSYTSQLGASQPASQPASHSTGSAYASSWHTHR